MTSDYNQNLWNTILTELQKTVPENLYQLWFKDTTIVSLSNDTMKIYVPNDIIKKRISETYLKDIETIVFRYYGDSPKIEFTTNRGPEQQTFFDFEDKIGQYWEKSELVQVDRNDNIEKIQRQLNLNEFYTFDNFVVGPSNQLAHASALAVANKPGETYNPLFMHGAVGLGKTHLLQAICHEVLQRKAGFTIVYLSCEEFVNEFITCVVEKSDAEGFRTRFREVDILLIDDIHFLANKERTQEEFFHTFNTLYNAQKQIILSCDSPPAEIPKLKERLASRFKWGLVSQIDVPTFETRVAIVKKKSRTKGIELTDDICQYVADNIVSNIRELEGAINRLLALSDLHGKEIDLEFSKFCLEDVLVPTGPAVEISEIVETVAHYYNVKVAELQSKKRSKNVVIPRQVGMYLCKKITKNSLQEIGGFFGGRDHTTVLHAIDKIKGERKSSKDLRNKLVELEHRILGDQFQDTTKPRFS